MPELEYLELQDTCRPIPPEILESMITRGLLTRLKFLLCAVASVHAALGLLEIRRGILHAGVYIDDHIILMAYPEPLARYRNSFT
jgi:hypothetical protein